MVLHNPNNWHWVDKNCIAWSRDYFKEQLVGTEASEGNAEVKVSSVKSVEGDVEVCQRKGKVISLFDVALDLAFEGKAGETPVAGSIKVPEVSYDSDEDDYQFQILIDNETGDKLAVKTLIRQKLVPQLREKLAKFGKDLINTHGGGIQHTGNEPIHWSSNSKIGSSASATKPESSSAASSKQTVFGVAAYNTTSLKVEPVFNASPEQLYATLLTPQLIAAWSRSAPQVTPKVGGEFALFGGNVTGKFLELVEGKKIKVSWRLRDWKAGHHATVVHDFVVGDGETKMVTSWEGIPVGQEEAVEANFNDYYVKPIKVTFGYGLV